MSKQSDYAALSTQGHQGRHIASEQSLQRQNESNMQSHVMVGRDMMNDTGTIDSSVMQSLRQFSLMNRLSSHDRIIPNLQSQPISLTNDLHFNELDDSVRQNSGERQFHSIEKTAQSKRNSILSQSRLQSIRNNREFVRYTERH